MQPINPNDPAQVQHFSLLAAQATSVNAPERESAEQRIKQFQDQVDQQTGLVPLLLHMSTANLPASQFCSILFKNTVKQCWNPSTAEHCIQESDKEYVKEHIIHCVINTSSSATSVQRNIAAAIALIADIDFPLKWPNALDVVIHALNSAHEQIQQHEQQINSNSNNDNSNNNISRSNSSIITSPVAAGSGVHNNMINSNTISVNGVAMHTNALTIQAAALSTAHSILVKYREQTEESEPLISELEAIYTSFLPPLIRTMKSLTEICERVIAPEAVIACHGVISAVECLRDITALDLGYEFVKSIDVIVNIFLHCLALENAMLHCQGNEDNGPLVELKSIVTSCVTHFLNQYDEDFDKFAAQFSQVIWNMLAKCAQVPSAANSDLVIRGLELVTSACKGSSRAVYDNTDVLQSLIHQVLLPNLQLQDSDIELFSNEPEEYVQRDIEGSDLHTRRRAASELLRALIVSLPEKARPLLSNELNRIMTSEASQDWRAKDLAIYLASLLAIEGQHIDVQRGAVQQLGGMVAFDSFVRSTILPELSSMKSITSPSLIKADCIRVIASFRAHIDSSLFPTLLHSLTKWLGDGEDYVVMTYAANAIERLLLVQQQQEQQQQQQEQQSQHSSIQYPTSHIYTLTPEIFAPHASRILEHLCVALLKAEQPNVYIAQCLMRVCQRQPESVIPHVADIIICMNIEIGKASKNPSNALFSYCLFEITSKCIALCPEHVHSIESQMWNTLIQILANNVEEYVPYVLQILAQLLRSYPAPNAKQTFYVQDSIHSPTNTTTHSLTHSNSGANFSNRNQPQLPPLSISTGVAELNNNNNNNLVESGSPVHSPLSLSSSLSPSSPLHENLTNYQQLYAPLLKPEMYTQRSNIPAVVCLITAFIERCPEYIISNNHVRETLNVVAELVRLKNYDHEGFNILNAMLLYLPHNALDEFLPNVYRLLMERLQRARTPKYVRILIILLSVIVIVRGAGELVRQLNSIQSNLFIMLLKNVWLPHVQRITGLTERKTCIVALAQLLCYSPELQASDNGRDWANVVYSCLRMIHTAAEQDDLTSFSPVAQTVQNLADLQRQQLEETGFTSAFCPLPEAMPKPVDVCANISNPDQYFREQITQLLRRGNPHLLSVLQSTLTPELLALIHHSE